MLNLLNKILEKHHEPIINGYYNSHDQDEYAIINLKDFLEGDIKKSQYLNVTHINIEGDNIEKLYNFPLNQKEYNLLSNTGVGYSDLYVPRKGMLNKYRMYCNGLKRITYQGFDDPSKSIKYECLSKDEYYKTKYMKYKQKYISLKNALKNN